MLRDFDFSALLKSFSVEAEFISSNALSTERNMMINVERIRLFDKKKPVVSVKFDEPEDSLKLSFKKFPIFPDFIRVKHID